MFFERRLAVFYANSEIFSQAIHQESKNNIVKLVNQTAKLTESCFNTVELK
jgi:hypothetical protein